MVAGEALPTSGADRSTGGLACAASLGLRIPATAPRCEASNRVCRRGALRCARGPGDLGRRRSQSEQRGGEACA
eukprot:scaffold52032_cov73-Phaeocystis_antarctica.AAC.2